MFHFCTPWKCQKTRGFLTFSGGYKNGILTSNTLNSFFVIDAMNHGTIVDAQKEIAEYVGDKGLNVLFNNAGQIQGKGYLFSVTALKWV